MEFRDDNDSQIVDRDLLCRFSDFESNMNDSKEFKKTIK